MVFCRILRYFVIFVIYAVLSRNMFLAIHALLRGDKFNKKLCPWRKNDKYEVWGHHHQIQSLQQNSVKCNKTQCIVHAISSHY